MGGWEHLSNARCAVLARCRCQGGRDAGSDSGDWCGNVMSLCERQQAAIDREKYKKSEKANDLMG